MRVLSVGVPLPGPVIDNYSFTAAPAFFDYDALVIDPEPLSAVSDAGLLRDRRDETARLLDRGGLVVCYARANGPLEALPERDRYCWLPLRDGVAFDHPFVRHGGGTEVCVSDHEHAFAIVIERFGGKIAYEVHFAEDAPGFAPRVFARSRGGGAAGVELAAGEGRVVFLPPPARPPAGDQRYAYSNAIQDAIRQLLRAVAEAEPPRWIADYTLPGLSERLAAREEARARVDEAQQALAHADDAAREIERYRRLLWQEGKYGLEQVVREALALIGFEVAPANLDRRATVSLREPPVAALLEVHAAVQAVGLDGHDRLRGRLEEAARRGETRRGLLLINGYRALPPAKRPAQYQDGLREAAEQFGYCVAGTDQLFHAVRAALEGDHATARSFGERLVSTNGVLGED